MSDRYYVAVTDIGYVIRDTERTLPLPFVWCSRSNAQMKCDMFNLCGHRAIAEYYYVSKIAGTRDTEPYRKADKNPYEEWMNEHGDMFE